MITLSCVVASMLSKRYSGNSPAMLAGSAMRARPKLLGGREPLRQDPGQAPYPGKDPEEPKGEE